MHACQRSERLRWKSAGEQAAKAVREATTEAMLHGGPVIVDQRPLQ
ncbi:hypothetical protein [Cupriavidus pauculus]|nr:hypothetical protein [Cupriavidus pauculus]GJG96717.1 hypothetical protein CBA19C6_19530 [Cupriavidus pauculus]